MKRRKWTKTERRQIYDKYKGHCAYCGIKIKTGRNADRPHCGIDVRRS